MTDEPNTPAPDDDDDLIDEDPPSDQAPTDDEYAELLQRAVEKMIVGEDGAEDSREREKGRERLWTAFHEWVDDQTEEGMFDQYEVQAAVFLIIGGHNERWYRVRAPRLRAEVESAFFGEYLSKQPKEVQVDVLAELWRAAETHDKRSQPLFGWVKQLSKTMSREEVVRTMQAATDAHRAGQPLRMKDRVTMLAHEHLPKQTRIRTMAAALKTSGSTARDHEQAVNQMHSKAKDECADALADPHDFRIGTRLSETYPLVRDMIRHLVASGVIRYKTLREAWRLDGCSDDVLAGIEAQYGLESLIAVLDEQHEGLGVFRYLDEMHQLTRTTEHQLHVAEGRQVGDPQQVADPEQQNLQVADPEQL